MRAQLRWLRHLLAWQSWLVAQAAGLCAGCQQIFLESTELLVAVDQDAAEKQKAAGGESERAATLAGSRLCDRSAPRRYGEWNVPSNVGSEPTPPQPPPLPLTSKLFD